MPQTYVITGATSFIGKRLTAQLLADGQQVCAVCRDEATARQKLGDSKGLTVVEAQLEDYDRLSERIPHADVFIHLAWEGTGHDGRNMTEVQQSNIRHSHEAMQQAVSMGCQLFVEAGSQAEYGTQLQTITEDTPCQPFSEYGKAKLDVCRQGFAMAERLSIKYLHLRIFSLFGEDDHPWTLVMSCVDRMLRNESIALSACTQNWNFLYVADAARQISLLCQYALQHDEFRHEVFNIASEDTRQLREFVEEMHRLTRSHSVLQYGAIPQQHIVSLQPDISKLRNAIGFVSSVDFKTVINKIIHTHQ
ncbi:MAG: NAD(P)-dependent oxidoreductase [Prevotella sp.]|nr:NAD(P)-dependent oxidoreductase [Prevotella sp.]